SVGPRPGRQEDERDPQARPPGGGPRREAGRTADRRGHARSDPGRRFLMPSTNVYDIEPRINGEVRVGSAKGDNVVWAARLAERGNTDRILFDGSDNFVVLEVGKRGSGKSYGMGSLLEGFATSAASRISMHRSGRAVLLLDPLDVHWTALEALRADGPPGLVRQHAIVARWKDLEVEPINVRVFVPAGYEMDID